MDVGSYCIDAMRYFASSNPSSVLTASHLHPTTEERHKLVDRSVNATFSFDDKSIIGTIHGDLAAPLTLGFIPGFPQMNASIQCEMGEIQVWNYVMPTLFHSITVTKGKGKGSKPDSLDLAQTKRVEKVYKWRDVGVDAHGEDWWTTYRYQLEAFVDRVKGREPQTWVGRENAVDNLHWMEEVYSKVRYGYLSFARK